MSIINIIIIISNILYVVNILFVKYKYSYTYLGFVMNTTTDKPKVTVDIIVRFDKLSNAVKKYIFFPTSSSCF